LHVATVGVNEDPRISGAIPYPARTCCWAAKSQSLCACVFDK
jgi:hypothetical protein